MRGKNGYTHPMNLNKRAIDNTDDVQASIEHNNRKLTADKIISILNQVRNDKAKSNRRWIWELMQNAKDLPMPEAWGGVSVEIEYQTDRLIFRHNADPFRVANLAGLIQQVSSKVSDSSRQAQRVSRSSITFEPRSGLKLIEHYEAKRTKPDQPNLTIN